MWKQNCEQYRALTLQELEAELEDLEPGNEVDAVIIPPTVDDLTDEEDIDENALLGKFAHYKDKHRWLTKICFLGDLVPQDVAGTFELLVPEMENDDICVEPSTSKGATKRNTVYTPKWKKKHPEYDNLPVSNEEVAKKDLVEALADKSPLDIFFMFFDENLLNEIIYFSEKYAKDNNRHDFSLTITDLKRFIGILIFSGYHTLPQLELYWSRDEDKGVPLVKNCMSRNKFRNIKRNLHLCDNAKLDKNDKFAKLRPLFDAINKKNLQFGLFSHNLSIDEEMVPYFGRHSAKMFIKGKPVRFGFKLWCLCSDDGYLFQFMPYGGAREEKTEMGLGADVVVSLLKVVENPSLHRIFFDNFFSSYKLFSFLGEKNIYATGTIRDNRILNCTLESTKVIKKKARGSFDFRFDSKSNACVVRWNDNSVVTLITNNVSINPIQPVKRYDRKQKKRDKHSPTTGDKGI